MGSLCCSKSSERARADEVQMVFLVGTFLGPHCYSKISAANRDLNGRPGRRKVTHNVECVPPVIVVVMLQPLWKMLQEPMHGGDPASPSVFRDLFSSSATCGLFRDWFTSGATCGPHGSWILGGRVRKRLSSAACGGHGGSLDRMLVHRPLVRR